MSASNKTKGTELFDMVSLVARIAGFIGNSTELSSLRRVRRNTTDVVDYYSPSSWRRELTQQLLFNSISKDIIKPFVIALHSGFKCDYDLLFIEACRQHKINIFRFMIENGININAIQKNPNLPNHGDEAVEIVLEGNNMELLQLSMIQIMLKYDEDDRPLRFEALRYLHSLPANKQIFYINDIPEEALIRSIEDNDTETFVYLLKNCSTINCPFEGNSPLMLALDKNRMDMFDMLIEHNESLTYIFKDSGLSKEQSLFTIALEKENYTIAKLILEHQQTRDDPVFIEHIRNSARNNTKAMTLVAHYFP